MAHFHTKKKVWIARIKFIRYGEVFYRKEFHGATHEEAELRKKAFMETEEYKKLFVQMPNIKEPERLQTVNLNDVFKIIKVLNKICDRNGYDFKEIVKIMYPMVMKDELS